MLKIALLFLIVGLVAALFGFTSVAGASFAIAKFFAFLFLVLFLIFPPLVEQGQGLWAKRTELFERGQQFFRCDMRGAQFSHHHAGGRQFLYHGRVGARAGVA